MRHFTRDLILGALIALGAWLFPLLAARHARPLLLNLGPNDVEYVRGFREDWERDGLTRFHWTSLSASVRLPVHVAGPGQVLRMRARRHFLDPAVVTLRAEGRAAARFTLQADERVPYRVLEFPLPPLEGRDPFVLTIESAVQGARPLGVAIDWLEVARAGPDARFSPLASMRLALALMVLVAFVFPRLAGAGRLLAASHAGVVLVLACAGTWWDLVATERILRLGAAPYAVVAVLATAAVAFRGGRDVVAVPRGAIAGGLVVVVLAAALVRFLIVLHPQFYYPDVKVHALFAWQLARRGIVAFLGDFTANQYRYSLGLQMENGHWYAFPYPPVFYILTWPLVRLGRLRPEVAVSVLPAAVNSLEALVVFAIARRLSLAYFPALVGHAVDSLVILYLLSRITALARPRVVLTLAALVATALLTYTQSLLNFGILLPLFLVFLLITDRGPDGRRRALGLAVAGALGAVLSLVVFYGRYVPIVLDMRKGVPMAEERILLEKPAAPVDPEEQARAAAEPPDDPFAGPGLDPWRGVRKAAWRLYVFYGWFAPVVVAGLLLAWRRSPPAVAPFVAAWALTYLACNLASGGLPGPNLVRYNKDLEIVAPLFCAALALVGEWLWSRARLLAIAYAAGYGAYGVVRVIRDLTDRFVLER